MTQSTSPRSPRRRFRGRLPAFYPVPVRHRDDGWTARRQGHFLGYLAETGSVAEAARRVGMSRKGAYQLRARREAESFAAAWDVALGKPLRKVTVHDLHFLALKGYYRPVMRAGRFVRLVQKPSVTALLRYLDRLDRLTQGKVDENLW